MKVSIEKRQPDREGKRSLRLVYYYGSSVEDGQRKLKRLHYAVVPAKPQGARRLPPIAALWEASETLRSPKANPTTHHKLLVSGSRLVIGQITRCPRSFSTNSTAMERNSRSVDWFVPSEQTANRSG